MKQTKDSFHSRNTQNIPFHHPILLLKFIHFLPFQLNHFRLLKQYFHLLFREATACRWPLLDQLTRKSYPGVEFISSGYLGNCIDPIPTAVSEYEMKGYKTTVNSIVAVIVALLFLALVAVKSLVDVLLSLLVVDFATIVAVLESESENTGN